MNTETTYAFLREFAGSWALLAMFLFYVAAILRALSPGRREANREASEIVMRNDTLPRDDRGDDAASCTKGCDACGCTNLKLEGV